MAETTDESPTPRKIANLLLIWRFTARYKGHVAGALLALVVAALATLAIPSAFKLIIDRGFGGTGGDIGRWFQYLLLIVVVMGIATAFRFYFVSWLGERVVADVREAVQRNLLRLAPSFFEENRPSEIASRLTADTTIIEQVVGTTISVALRNVLMGLGGIIYLLALAPKLTGMLLLGIPIVVLPIVFLGRRIRNVSRSSQDQVAEVGAMVDEVLGAMKIVQGFGQEAREAGRFEAAVERVFQTARRRITLRAMMTAGVIALIFGSIQVGGGGGGAHVQSGAISGGTIAAFVLTGGLIGGAFG